MKNIVVTNYIIRLTKRKKKINDMNQDVIKFKLQLRC